MYITCRGKEKGRERREGGEIKCEGQGMGYGKSEVNNALNGQSERVRSMRGCHMDCSWSGRRGGSLWERENEVRGGGE